MEKEKRRKKQKRVVDFVEIMRTFFIKNDIQAREGTASLMIHPLQGFKLSNFCLFGSYNFFFLTLFTHKVACNVSDSDFHF